MANTKAIVVVSLSILTLGGIGVYLYIQNKNKKDKEAKALADSLNSKTDTNPTTKTGTPTSENKGSTNQTKTIPSTEKNQFFRVGDSINPTVDLGQQPIRINTLSGWQIVKNNDGSIKTTSISPYDTLKIVDFFPYNGVNYVVAETAWNKYPVAIQYFYVKLAPYQGGK